MTSSEYLSRNNSPPQYTEGIGPMGIPKVAMFENPTTAILQDPHIAAFN